MSWALLMAAYCSHKPAARISGLSVWTSGLWKALQKAKYLPIARRFRIAAEGYEADG
jgi:hypothetical protein